MCKMDPGRGKRQVCMRKSLFVLGCSCLLAMTCVTTPATADNDTESVIVLDLGLQPAAISHSIELIETLTDQAPGTAKIGLVAASDIVLSVVEPVRAPEFASLLEEQITLLEHSRSRAFPVAVERALDMFNAQGDNATLLLITDGVIDTLDSDSDQQFAEWFELQTEMAEISNIGILTLSPEQKESSAWLTGLLGNDSTIEWPQKNNGMATLMARVFRIEQIEAEQLIMAAARTPTAAVAAVTEAPAPAIQTPVVTAATEAPEPTVQTPVVTAVTETPEPTVQTPAAFNKPVYWLIAALAALLAATAVYLLKRSRRPARRHQKTVSHNTAEQPLSASATQSQASTMAHNIQSSATAEHSLSTPADTKQPAASTMAHPLQSTSDESPTLSATVLHSLVDIADSTPTDQNKKDTAAKASAEDNTAAADLSAEQLKAFDDFDLIDQSIEKKDRKVSTEETTSS